VVKRIFFEEIVDRELLKRFLQRFQKLTGLSLLPFNERGEAVVGDPAPILGGVNEAEDLVHFPDRQRLSRHDGASLRLLKLELRGHLYGAVLIGPYIGPGDAYTGQAPLPRLTDEQIEAAAEMIEQFFGQQVEIAAEREDLRRKEKILSVLEEASNIMNSSLDFQNLLEFLMDIAIDITGATCGALLLKKEKKRYLEVAVARGKFPQEVKKIRVPIGKGVTGWVARNREPLIVPNVLLEPRYIETPETIYSEMAVPLVVGDRLIGVVAVDSSEMNAFSKEDCTILSTLASMVTKVLENARLLAESQQKIREMTRLFAISERLAGAWGESEGVLDAVLNDAMEAIGCAGMALMFYNSDREDLAMVACRGLPVELEHLRIPLGKGIHGWVAQQRKPLLITDATQDLTIAKHSFLDQFSRSFLCIPLQTPERLVGVLGAYQKREKGVFQEDDQQLLTTIGQLLTAFFENRRLFEDSRRKLEYFSTLYKVSSSVSRTLNISKLFGMILQQVQDVMDVENCSLMMYDAIKNQLTLDAAIGLPKDMVGKIRVEVGEGIAGWVAQHKQPVFLKDISKDERFVHRHGRLDYKTRSVLSVPIMHNKVLLGVLNVNNKRSGQAFTEDDLNLLLGISGQISQALANANLHERTEQQVAELSLIQELGKAINSSLDLDSVLNYFIDMTSRILEADRSTLMLYDEQEKELYVQVSRGFEDKRIREIRFKIGEGIAGRAAELRKPIRVAHTHLDQTYKRLPFSETEKACTLISAPLMNRDHLIGVINCERELDKKGPFTAENLDLLDTLASQASVAIQNARLYNNLLNYYFETIQALAAAIDAKDSYTHGHSRRVTDLSIGIAQVMGLSRDEVHSIRHAALLHDVGKIGISEQILLKPGRLTDEEFETIKTHPHIGAGILDSIEFLKTVCLMIEHHHERYDGRGYPAGLKGEEIPLGARIIGVADSFDAITSTRPYRKPLTFAEASNEILRCSGTQFDPAVVKAFMQLRDSPFCPEWLKQDALEEPPATARNAAR
jgi:HD-GYP domain-containing protein (c-di-GMP phosphodiesterase class II)